MQSYDGLRICHLRMREVSDDDMDLVHAEIKAMQDRTAKWLERV